MSKPAIKREQQTELVHALNAAVASLQHSAHSEADVLRVFREQVVALGMRGGISLLDASRKRLTMRAIAYPDPILSLLDELERLTGLKADGFEFAVADADAYQQAVETRQAVFVPNNNVVVAQLLPQAVRPFAERIQGVFGGAPSISAPLTTHGQVTGLLIVVSAGLTRDDVSAVQAFANHLAVALDNARAVSALQESEARYRVLFEQSPDGILLIDVETGKTIEANETAYEQLGYTREEFAALRISDYEALEKPEETAKHMQKIMREGSDDFETLHRTKSGEIRNVHVWAKTLSLGERVLFYAIFQDITESKRAEEALHESDRLLRESQIIAGLGSYVLDFTTGMWKSSGILDKLFGIDETYVRSIEGWADLVHPDERQQMIDYFTNEVIGKRVRFDKEYKIIRKNDQAERWVHGVGELEVDAQNQLLKMHGTITDITERKQTEAKLWLQATALDAAANSVFITDSKGVIHWVNPAFSHITGFTAEQAVGRTPRILKSGQYPREFYEELWRTILAGDVWQGEMINRHRAGGHYTVHQTVTPLRGPDGEIAHFVAIQQDITERVRAEQALRESEERFRTALKHSQIVVFNQDQELRYTWIHNPHPAFSVEAVLGKTDAELLPPEDAAHLTGIKRRVLESGIGAREEVRTTINAQAFYYDLTVEPLRDLSGNIVGITCATMDITERKQTEDETRLLLSLTQAINEAPGFDSALRIALQTVCESTGWDMGEAWIPGADGRALVLSLVWYGLRPDLETFSSNGQSFVFPPGKGLPGRAWASRQPEWLKDVSVDGEIFPRAALALKAGLKSALAIPTLAGDQMLVLVFFMKEAREKDERLVEIVSAAAGQLGSLFQRKQAEEALGLSEEKYRTLVDEVNDGFYVTDSAGVFTFVNHALARLHGVENPQALVGRKFSDFVVPEMQAELGEAYHTAMQTGSATDIINGQVMRPDGTRVFIEIKPAYVVKEGQIVGSRGVVRDVTKRKRAEEALREAEIKYRLLVERLPVIVYTSELGVNGTWPYVSPQIEQLFGFTPQEWMANPELWFQQVHPEDRDRQEQLEEQAYARGEAFVSEYRIFTRAGRQIWIRDSAQILPPQSGGAPIVQGVLMDITASKQEEEQLQQLNDDLALINTLNNAVNRGDNLQRIVQLLSQETSRVFNCRGATIYLLSDDRDYLELQNVNLPPVLVSQIKKLIGRDLPHARISLKHGSLYRKVLQAGAPQIINDPAAILQLMAGFTESKVLQNIIPAIYSMLGIRSVMAAPFVSEGEAIGLLEASRSEPFTELELERFAAIARQLTVAIKRKQAEEALRHSNNLLDLTGQMAKVGGWEMNLETQTLRWTEEVYRIHEVNPATRLNVAEANNFYAPESQPVISAAVQACIDSGTPWDLELQLITAEGRRIWVRAQGAAERRDGKIVRLYGAFQEITERKRAEEQINRRVIELEALYQSGIGFSQTLDPRDIAEKVIEVLAGRLNWHHAAVRVRRQNSDEVELLAFSRSDEHQYDKSRVQSLITHVGQGMSGWVIENGQIVRSGDVNEDARYVETYAGTKSGLYIPMKTHNRTIGCISVESDRPNAFTEDDERLTMTLSNQAASALEHARLFEETGHRLKNLQSLQEIDKAITGSTDLSLTLDVILGQVISQLNADAAVILLYDQTAEVLKYAMARGFRTEALQHTRLPLGDGYAGRVALGRRMIHLPDLQTRKTDFLRSPAFSQEGFVSYFGVPLIAKGEIQGVLEIFHRAAFEVEAEWLNFLETLAVQTAIAIDNASLLEGLQLSNVELGMAYDATIAGWSHALDLRDKETEGHTLRVTEITERLARAMGISEAEIIHIRRGALLHDIGKMGVPDGILLKPDKLTDEEWIIMRRHPQFAFDMLSPIAYLKPALDIPYCHHEKWDGTGYPRGLKGEQIPLAARIFAVIDVYDALTSDRPYRPAWSKDEALEYIQDQSGKHFDPPVVEAFLKMIAEGRLP